VVFKLRIVTNSNVLLIFLKEPCPKHLEDSLSTDNDCVIIHDKEIFLLTSLSIRFSKVIKKMMPE
jgi:hypothetical protein